MIIAFSGSDGSGKSTLLKEVAAELDTNSVEYTTHREFIFYYLTFLNKVRQTEASKAYKNTVINSEPSTQSHMRKKIIEAVYGISIIIEHVLEYINYELIHRKRILLRDRYAIDYAIGFQHTKTSWIASKILRHFPRPSLHFITTLDPKIAMKRMTKTRTFTFSKEYYQHLTNMYDAFDEKQLIRIDTSSKTAFEIARRASLIRAKLLHIKTIAISGLDGAGKSTTVAELSATLDEIGVRHKSTHFYYNYIILKLLRPLRRQHQGTESEQHEASREAELQHSRKRKSVLWTVFVLSDAFVQYLWTRATRRGRLLIYDRFFPDYYVSFDFLNAPYRRSTLESILPKPDRYYLQIADYEILYKRKPEHTISFFKECYAKYIELSKTNNMILLDSTSQNKNEILTRLLKGL